MGRIVVFLNLVANGDAKRCIEYCRNRGLQNCKPLQLSLEFVTAQVLSSETQFYQIIARLFILRNICSWWLSNCCASIRHNLDTAAYKGRLRTLHTYVSEIILSVFSLVSSQPIPPPQSPN